MVRSETLIARCKRLKGALARMQKIRNHKTKKRDLKTYIRKPKLGVENFKHGKKRHH